MSAPHRHAQPFPLGPRARGILQIARDQRSQRLGLVLWGGNTAELGHDHVGHPLRACGEARARSEHAENDRPGRSLGRTRAEHANVECGEHIGHICSGGIDEVRALPQRLGKPAQLRFSLAPTGHDQVYPLVLERTDGANDHVIALLGMKARDAPDHKGLRGDTEAIAHACPSLLGVADLIGAHYVGNHHDLRRRYAHIGDRATRTLGDRHHKPGALASMEVGTPRQAPAQGKGNWTPLRPNDCAGKRGGQRGAQQLLLLVVDQQNVVGGLLAQCATQTHEQRRPAQDQAGPASGG